MGYIGSALTRTPLHTDKVATVAFNLQVFGTGTKKWWLIDSKEIHNLARKVPFFTGNDVTNTIVNTVAHHLPEDKVWVAPEELVATGLHMWYHEQKEGHLMLVPPNSPHQVMNDV